MSRLASAFAAPLAAAVLIGVTASPGHAATRAEPVRVAATEVTLAAKAKDRGAAITDALRAASAAEANYYDPAHRPVVMRITIDKLGFKSAGKAIAASLPLVGMFSGANRNVMKGEVELVDQASGKPLAHYKITCDDDTQMSAADGALTYAKVGLSFLPFGGLIGAAMDAADGAANKQDAAERMLTRGFVMLSYKKVYGDTFYRSFAQQRKAAFEAAKAAPASAAPAVTAR